MDDLYTIVQTPFLSPSKQLFATNHAAVQRDDCGTAVGAISHEILLMQLDKMPLPIHYAPLLHPADSGTLPQLTFLLSASAVSARASAASIFWPRMVKRYDHVSR